MIAVAPGPPARASVRLGGRDQDGRRLREQKLVIDSSGLRLAKLPTRGAESGMSIDARARTQTQTAGQAADPWLQHREPAGQWPRKSRQRATRTRRTGCPGGRPMWSPWGARERMFCHVTPIRTPCSRSLASYLVDLICRIAEVRPHTYALACVSLTMATIVNCRSYWRHRTPITYTSTRRRARMQTSA